MASCSRDDRMGTDMGLDAAPRSKEFGSHLQMHISAWYLPNQQSVEEVVHPKKCPDDCTNKVGPRIPSRTFKCPGGLEIRASLRLTRFEQTGLYDPLGRENV